MPKGMARWRPKPPNEGGDREETRGDTVMNLGFGNPLPLIFARMVTQSGTAAAAWSGMWYGLAMGAMGAATGNAGRPDDEREPEAAAAMPAPPATLARPARATGRKGGAPGRR